jgi:precorrin-2 dehydrogenase/sirohydrochlorin ferrochelatase
MMNIEGRRALVVGGGKVAYRKIEGLLDCGALVTVVSPEAAPEIVLLAEEGKVDWRRRPFHEAILDETPPFCLVFGTTNRRDVNVETYRAATARMQPCNIADVPDLCTFFVPAVITQGELLIAVSTGGASPALARRIRRELEEHFGPEYAEMTRLLRELRKIVVVEGSSSDDNKKLFTDIVDSEILDALKRNDRDHVLKILRAALPGAEDLDRTVHLPSDETTAKD